MTINKSKSEVLEKQLFFIRLVPFLIVLVVREAPHDPERVLVFIPHEHDPAVGSHVLFVSINPVAEVLSRPDLEQLLDMPVKQDALAQIFQIFPSVLVKNDLHSRSEAELFLDLFQGVGLPLAALLQGCHGLHGSADEP